MFKRVVEALLRGEFLCPTAYTDEYGYLRQPDNFRKVADYLAPLDRALCTLDGSEAFYAGYTAIDETNRGLIREAFSEIRSQLRPVVEWMDLVMTAMGSDRPVRARDEIRLHQMLRVIEPEPSLCEQMARLTQMPFFRTARTNVAEQLLWVLQKLEQSGYLVKPNPQGATYLVTGKMDYLHQVIAFLNDAEELELDESEDNGDQTELFQ
ncbi:condensin complex protein MksE [Methylobacter sp.]|uniref:condensin complex protein MksE n=1 Tax=Methylobacter sp. TaxID=2051955 RepID=UPI003DA68CC8